MNTYQILILKSKQHLTANKKDTGQYTKLRTSKCTHTHTPHGLPCTYQRSSFKKEKYSSMVSAHHMNAHQALIPEPTKTSPPPAGSSTRWSRHAHAVVLLVQCLPKVPRSLHPWQNLLPNFCDVCCFEQSQEYEYQFDCQSPRFMSNKCSSRGTSM